MNASQICFKIFLLFSIASCSNDFDEAYKTNSTLRQRILSEAQPSVDMKELISIDVEGVCIIEYVADLKYLPIISGVQLTKKEIYLPPGDQYINLLFFSNSEWRQVVFKSSELRISSTLNDTMTYNNYCRKGKRITLFKTPSQSSSFTTIVTIEG